MEIVNAIIESVHLKIERDSFLTLDIVLDYGGLGQVFGGYVLYNSGLKHRDSGTNYCGWYISSILDTVGVSDINSLKDKVVRIKRGKGPNGTVQEIGHPILDKWFNPKEY